VPHAVVIMLRYILDFIQSHSQQSIDWLLLSSLLLVAPGSCIFGTFPWILKLIVELTSAKRERKEYRTKRNSMSGRRLRGPVNNLLSAENSSSTASRRFSAPIRDKLSGGRKLTYAALTDLNSVASSFLSPTPKTG